MPDPSDGPKAALRDAKLFIDRKKDESIRILVAIQAIQGDTAVHWVCSENCEGFDIASEMCDTVILEESYEEAYRIGYADGYIDGLVARTRAFVASLSDEQSPPIEAKLLDCRLPSASEPHGTGPVGDETDDLPAHDDSGSQRHTIEPTGEAPMPRFTLLVCPNGNTLRREWAADEQPSLAWLSACVGGPIELVLSRGKHCFAYLNGNGMLDGLPANDHLSEWLPPNGAYAYHGAAILLFGFAINEDTSFGTRDIAEVTAFRLKNC